MRSVIPLDLCWSKLSSHTISVQINASSLLQIPSYQPVATASKIECPIILIADSLCPLTSAMAVIDAAKHAELVKLTGGE
jgi:hypothetical protein